MQLAIESASDEPGIALARRGMVERSRTWRTERNHSVELLPNIEALLDESTRGKGDIAAVFVDIGPGGYAALRVGVSIARALAHALQVPLVGIGRLELDARSVAPVAEQRIVAVHRAGRGDYAWAAYRNGDAWAEDSPPRITKLDGLHHALRSGDWVTGDIDEALDPAIADAGAATAAPAHHRVVALASLGHDRLAAGRTDDPRSLVPLYLRAPAIGPQS